MRENGIIPKSYPRFSPSGDLAEYIGVMLGDGNISKFPRTERLIIVSNANNKGFINHYALLTTKLFAKEPGIFKMKNVQAVRITLYQKYISQRLSIPTGNRSKLKIQIPAWIHKDKLYLVRFLKGLYEAEASLSIHLPTCTYNFSFANRNVSLLDEVEKGLVILGFHPRKRTTAVELRKKEEVRRFEKLISFRKYPLV